jgi:hypothetical protein
MPVFGIVFSFFAVYLAVVATLAQLAAEEKFRKRFGPRSDRSALVVAEVHNRMPVILPRDAYDQWLDPEKQNVQDLKRPFPADRLFARKVSTYVSNSKRQGPECIEVMGV